jgi:hypothetical protein
MLWTNEAIESLKPTSTFAKLASRSYILSEIRLRINTICSERVGSAGSACPTLTLPGKLSHGFNMRPI